MRLAKLRIAAMLAGLCGCCYAFVPAMDGLWGDVVHAASDQPVTLTKEQAVQISKALPIQLDGYELTDRFPDDRLSFERGSSVWTVDWSKREDEKQQKWLTVDVATGKLLKYTLLKSNDQIAADARLISREEALRVAQQFLAAVAPEELRHAAGPNLYEAMDPFPPRAGVYHFSFTRMEKGIPFLENDLQVTVDVQGEIVLYQRNWFDGTLPDPVPLLSEEEARKRWDETAQPTLGYVYAGEEIQTYGLKQKKIILAYHYAEKDPALIDARTGQSLNRLGEIISEPEKMVTLGESAADTEYVQKELKEYEKEEKADQIAKTLFQAQRDRRKSGGSLFASMDDFGEGSSSQNSLFFYVRPAQGGEREKRYSLGMDSYGNITHFSLDEEQHEGDEHVISHPISYEKAQSIAADFLKKLLPDRLGEIYPIELPPTEDSKEYLFQHGGGYHIVFGWLKQGIPVESLENMVVVDPQTGEVTGMYSIPPYQRLEEMQRQSAGIERHRSKQVEGETQQFLLTYFMPHPEWRQGSYLVKREPKLVYRMTGDDGVVDARSGEWISFTAYRQSKIPGDITAHPQRAALVQASEKGYFPVTDGRLSPDTLVTRGEFLRILLRGNQFYGSLHSSQAEAEEARAYADVDESHPLYQIVQDAISIGLVKPASEKERFHPDRPITLQEANRMGNDLLGTEDRDHAFTHAGPHDAMTRADVAVWLTEWEAAAKNSR